MNEYQKAIKRGIEKGLDKHYSDKAAKEDYLPIHGDYISGKLSIEPKVWLTVDEAMHVHNMYLHQFAKLTGAGKEFIASLRNRIEQAEKER